MIVPADVIAFWLNVGPDGWYEIDPKLDAEIRHRFEPLWREAHGGELVDWEATPEGTLALLIVLDQFPRNMFRGSPDAFATDARARDVARRAIIHNTDLAIGADMREFFYTPLMHSEHLADQHWCVALIQARLGGDTGKNYPFALQHREIIERFGRFPARNAALGRKTTLEERAFLATPEQG